MYVVVAMDSFKGVMSANEACQRVAAGIHSVCGDAQVSPIPVADGGEGTADVFMRVRKGEWISCQVTGPLPGQGVHAGFVWIENDRTAVIEMASASGLALLKPHELNPLRTTTYGTGELIAQALEKGARKILLALGGSATVDGGVGAAMALGWRFLDASGNSIGLGGGALESIAKIEKPRNPFPVPLVVLCDVKNPLTGPQGAAHIFGPQKGATPAMVECLEDGLCRLGNLIHKEYGMDLKSMPGAGAAGGLAGGASVFFNGKLSSGIQVVMDELNLKHEINKADWVLTGEGRFDHQSLGGKVVSGILGLAQQSAAKVGVLAGMVQMDESAIRAAGLAFAWPTAPASLPFEKAVRTAAEDLEKTAARFAASYLVPSGRMKQN